MKLQLIIFTILTGLLSAGLHGSESQPLDRIEIVEGAVLTGVIEETTSTHVRLKTTYAGTLVVDRASIVRIYNTADIPQPSGESLAVKASAEAVAVVQPAEVTPEEPEIWSFEAGLNLNGNQGNTEKLDLALTADVEMDREFDRLGIYGRYSYGKNRGDVTANEIVLGSQYTNFFYKRIGFFFREELEHDDAEGLLYRSTTASGISWKVKEMKTLKIETRSGLSYRYEDYKDDGYEDFPGMDFGLSVDWQFTEWARLKGSYTYLPSVSDFNNYILKHDTGFNLPLDYSDLWVLRFGLISKYNNQPDAGRERLDHKYYARLIASWH
jgi:hypothetical protein